MMSMKPGTGEDTGARSCHGEGSRHTFLGDSRGWAEEGVRKSLF